ncbi:alpha/beta hydrolase [Brevibacterium sanguinis]|uniref:alpha/beta fold hydrolase n=1 Tax=Brevibacterium sanguinis TaxID=232444 RepID=UPI0031DEAE5E
MTVPPRPDSSDKSDSSDTSGSSRPPHLDPGDGLTEEIVTLADGRRIRTVTAGEAPGPCIVFEAGMGASAAAWTHIQREVATRTRTVSYDRANIGGSADDRSPRSLERIVDDLAEVVDQVAGNTPVVLVGHSWGGPIVRLFAHLNPERVAGMVLVDATASAILSPAVAALNAGSMRLGSLLIRAGQGDRFTRTLLPDGASPLITEADLALFWRDSLTQRAMRMALREERHVTSSIALMRMLERDGGPDVPGVVLQGGRQRGLLERRMRSRQNAAAATNVDTMPQGRLVVLEDAGHLVTHERPDAVIDAVDDVLSR